MLRPEDTGECNIGMTSIKEKYCNVSYYGEFEGDIIYEVIF